MNKTEHWSVVQKIVSHNSAPNLYGITHIVQCDDVRYFATVLVTDTRMTPATFIRKFRYISLSPECDRLLSCNLDPPKVVHLQTLDHVKPCSEINKKENVYSRGGNESCLVALSVNRF